MYSTAYTNDAVFILGGYKYNTGNVAEFKDNHWRRDQLIRARFAHGSITIDGDTMIVGGVALPGVLVYFSINLNFNFRRNRRK